MRGCLAQCSHLAFAQTLLVELQSPVNGWAEDRWDRFALRNAFFLENFDGLGDFNPVIH